MRIEIRKPVGSDIAICTRIKRRTLPYHKECPVLLLVNWTILTLKASASREMFGSNQPDAIDRSLDHLPHSRFTNSGRLKSVIGGSDLSSITN